MKVILRMNFKPPDEKAVEEMRALVKALTKDPAGIRIEVDSEPNRLVAEFTMPTEAQYKAVDKIDAQLECGYCSGDIYNIRFPPSEAARAKARRKGERRKARNAAKRAFQE